MFYHTLLTFLHLHILVGSVAVEAPQNVALGHERKIIRVGCRGVARDTWAGITPAPGQLQHWE